MTNSSPVIPVVMCTWKRIALLPRTIELLNQQVNANPELHIWNNNWEDRKEVDEAVKDAVFPVRIHHSQDNVGGFGRYYLAKELSEQFPFVVFIDDDQDFDEHALATFGREFKPKTISAFWSFGLTDPDDYWHGRIKPKPGDEVDYCGTGGMVADSQIFTEPKLFECPKKYWFVEDLWLSYFAKHVKGWKLYKSSVDIVAKDDGKDTYRSIKPLKNEFLRYLVDQGWQLTGSR